MNMDGDDYTVDADASMTAAARAAELQARVDEVNGILNKYEANTAFECKELGCRYERHALEGDALRGQLAMAQRLIIAAQKRIKWFQHGHAAGCHSLAAGNCTCGVAEDRAEYYAALTAYDAGEKEAPDTLP